MQPKKGDARSEAAAQVDSESMWVRLTKQLFLDLAYMSLVSGWIGLRAERVVGVRNENTYSIDFD